MGDELQEPRWEPDWLMPHCAQPGSWRCCAYFDLWGYYLPSALTTTKSTTIINRPEAPTAAAVSSPEIDDAIVSPARTNMIIRSIITPRGVLIMLMIEPEPLDITNTSPKTE